MYENPKPHTEGPPERDPLEDRMRKESREDSKEIARLLRLLQWCEVRLPEHYRAGLRRMITNPSEPDHTHIVAS